MLLRAGYARNQRKDEDFEFFFKILRETSREIKGFRGGLRETLITTTLSI